MEPNTTPTPTPAAPPGLSAAEVESMVQRGIESHRTREQERAAAITALAKKYKMAEKAGEWIAAGRSLDSVREEILNTIAERDAQPLPQPSAEMITLSEKEVGEYSILRAIRAAAGIGERGLEHEISDTLARKLKKSTEGFFLPSNLRMSGDVLRSMANPRLAEMARAMGMEFTRATLQTGSAGAGGNAVETSKVGFIDLLRNKMMVQLLGATVLSGLQGNVDIPTQATAGTLSWTGENPGSDVAQSDLTFGKVSLSPKTAQSTTAYSKQLLIQSSVDVEALVRNDLTTIAALGIDSAAINGSGSSNQPTGILNTGSLSVVAIGTDGGAPTYNHIVSLEETVDIANALMGALAYLTTPGMRKTLKLTQRFSGTDGKAVWENGEMNGYRAESTNQVPSNLSKGNGSNLHAIIFGNWEALLVGEWGAVEILVDPYAKKKQGLIEVTEILMIDVAVRRIAEFAAIKDAVKA